MQAFIKGIGRILYYAFLIYIGIGLGQMIAFAFSTVCTK
jgi:hypothetical protein